MSPPLRIVFMGTPDFAVPSLQSLLDGPDQVVAVVCQPDRQRGRGKILSPTAGQNPGRTARASGAPARVGAQGAFFPADQST